MKIHHNTPNRERGIALLMALGFSALLTVMVMGFLTSSLIEYQAASATAAKTSNISISDSATTRFLSEVSCAMTIVANQYYSTANTSGDDIHANGVTEFVNQAPDPGLFRFDNFVSRETNDEGFTYKVHGGKKSGTDQQSALAVKFASWTAPTKQEERMSLNEDVETSSSKRDEARTKMSVLGLYDTLDHSVSGRLVLTAGQNFRYRTDSLTDPRARWVVTRTIYEYPTWDKTGAGIRRTRTAWGYQDWGYYDTGDEPFKSTIKDYDLRFVQPQWRYIYRPITVPTPQKRKSGGGAVWSTDPIPEIAGRYWYAVVPDAGRIHKSALFDYPNSTSSLQRLPRIGATPRELLLDESLGDSLWYKMSTPDPESEDETDPSDPDTDSGADDKVDPGDQPDGTPASYALTRKQLQLIYDVVAPDQDDMEITSDTREANVKEAEDTTHSPGLLEPILAHEYMNNGGNQANAARMYTYYLYNLLDFTPRTRREINEKYFVRATSGSRAINSTSEPENRPKRFNLAMPGVIIDDNPDITTDWVGKNADYHGLDFSQKWSNIILGTSAESHGWGTESGSDHAFKWDTDSFYFRGLKADDKDILRMFRFLSLIGDSSEETSTRSVKQRRLQIAANLMDYNDPDDIPSSNSSNWFDDNESTWPTVTGNERTPYVNEVNLKFDPKLTCRVIGAVDKRYISFVRADLDVEINAELVNFFAGDVKFEQPLYLYIQLDGNILSDLKIDLGDGVSHTVSLRHPLNLSKDGTIGTPPESVYKDAAPDWVDGVGTVSLTTSDTILPDAEQELPYIVLKFTPGNGTYATANATGKIPFSVTFTNTAKIQHLSSDSFEVGLRMEVENVKIKRMILSSGLPVNPKEVDNNVDFVRELAIPKDISSGIDSNFLLYDEEIEESFNAAKTYTTASKHTNFAFEAKDGRDNLFEGSWEIAARDGTIGSKNRATNILADDANNDYHYTYKDGSIEVVGNVNGIAIGENTDPATLGDYKIKNATMVSPAELGLIHRALPHQTIRLDRAAGDYNAPKNFNRSTTDSGNGTTFEEGDGGILEFAYISDPNSRIELINLNTRSINIWRSLFYNVPFSDATDELGEYKFNTVIGSGQSDYKITPNLPDGTDDVINLSRANNIAHMISKIVSEQRLFFQCRSDILRPLNEIPGSIEDASASIDDGLSDSKDWNRNLLDLALEYGGEYGGSNKLTPKERGVIAGRILGLTEAERYPKRFNMVMVTQNINDVGGLGYNSKGEPIFLPVGAHDRSFVDASGYGTSIAKISDSFVIRDCRIGDLDVMQNKALKTTGTLTDAETAARGLVYFDKILSQERLLVRMNCTEDEKGMPVLKVISITNLDN